MTAETIIIIGIALILLGVAGMIVIFLIMVMSKKLNGITAYIEHETLRYRKRACDVACGGRILLDERESEKMIRIGYAYYLTKDKERKIAEDEALIKRMQESKDMVEPLEDELSDDDDEEQEATDEQQRVEAVEEVGEDLQATPYSMDCIDAGSQSNEIYIPGALSQVNDNHRTAAEKIALVNKDSANPADEAVAAIKATLEAEYGEIE